MSDRLLPPFSDAAVLVSTSVECGCGTPTDGPLSQLDHVVDDSLYERNGDAPGRNGNAPGT